MNRYDSNLKTCDYALYPAPPYKGKGWHITIEDEPSDSKFAGGAILNSRRLLKNPYTERAEET
jgi:hypothetical protein